MTRLLKALALLTALLLPVGMVHAQAPKTPPTAEQRQNELEAAFQAALEVATKGPAEVKLLEQGAFNVPANLLFIPAEPGKRLMRALGNTTSPVEVEVKSISDSFKSKVLYNVDLSALS